MITFPIPLAGFRILVFCRGYKVPELGRKKLTLKDLMGEE